MTTTTDSPETSALDCLIRIAEAVPGATALHAAVRAFATALHVEGALSGLTAMADARLAAATIAEVAVTDDDPVAALRIRAAAIRAGVPGLHRPRRPRPGARRRRDRAGRDVSAPAPRPLPPA